MTRRASVAIGLTVLVGCGVDFSTVEVPRFADGARIRFTGWFPDSGEARLGSPFDEALGAPCAPVPTADDGLRCVPLGPSPSVYADPACTEVLAVDSAERAEASCRVPFVLVPGLALDGGPPVTGLLRGAAPYEGSTVYLSTPSAGGCAATPVTEDLAVWRTEPVPLLELVAVEERAVARAGDLEEVLRTFEDGAFVRLRRFRAPGCELVDLEGDPDRQRCAPLGDGAELIRFRDPDCRLPMLGRVASASTPDYALLVRDERDREVRPVLSSLELSETYLPAAGRCLAVGLPEDPPLVWHVLGPPTTPDRFPLYARDTGGEGRLRAERFRGPDGRVLTLAPRPRFTAFWDVALELRCGPRLSADGSHRCFPLDLGVVDPSRFADAACEEPVATVAGAALAPTHAAALDPPLDDPCTGRRAPVTRVWRLGAPVEEAYAREPAGGACAPAPTLGRAFALDEEVPLDRFAIVREVRGPR